MHKIVQAPRLHIQFGRISPEEIVKERRYVFFLRNCPAGIRLMDTMEEATAEMALNFILGSCKGRFLHSIHKILTQASLMYIITS
jgi:hypothetical protein